jgi:AMMECR1 domain-containing protein
MSEDERTLTETLAKARASVKAAVEGKVLNGMPLTEHSQIKTALNMLTPNSGVTVDDERAIQVVRWHVDGLVACADGGPNGLEETDASGRM